MVSRKLKSVSIKLLDHSFNKKISNLQMERKNNKKTSTDPERTYNGLKTFLNFKLTFWSETINNPVMVSISRTSVVEYQFWAYKN